MLHKDPFIISPETFKLIQELQALEGLKSFNLVGGIALALQLGYRNSIDIDLFSQDEFLPDEIQELIGERYEFKITLAKKYFIIHHQQYQN
ncbi:MAG: hypothetical protein J0H55_06215 [Chitinophagaceae bacterium]|nr:hypothetical protein [Chitinophagaceae bacterium]